MNIKNINKNFKSGYSIIEIIVYLAIFTAISVLVINSFIVILSSFNTTNMNRKLLEAGSVSMERLSREIRQAQSINANTTATALILNSPSEVVKFIGDTNTGELNLYKDDNINPEGNIIGQNISLTNLIFRPIVTTESQAVKIEMTLLYSEKNRTKSENFYDTIILRGSY